MIKRPKSNHTSQRDQLKTEVGSQVGAIDTQHDFWLADANLQMAVAGTGSGAGEGGTRTAAVASAEPAIEQGDHHAFT